MAGPVDKGLPWIPNNFLALPDEQSDLLRASAVLIPVPYDSTTSFRSGARHGPQAIIEASYGLEDYDLELDLDVSTLGIHTTAALEPHVGSPERMVQRVRAAVAGYLSPERVVGVLGGEHSITVGAVSAHLEAFPDLSVLYLDAHADLRDEYLGSPWNHASGARRVHEMCPLTLVGVRSLCPEEREYLQLHSIPTHFWPPTGLTGEALNDGIVAGLKSQVYVSVDLDVLDPALMPAVGTPEPGGMDWYQVLSLLRALAESRRIVGFDVCELAPGEGPAACSYTAAKLAYKLVAYSVGLAR